MNTNLRQQLLNKFEDKEYRDAFVAEQIYSRLPLKIRALREDRGLTQKELGEKAGMAQAWVSKLEDPNYGKLTISTLLKVASACDVGLHVDFVPFSHVLNHSATLDRESFSVPSYEQDAALWPEEVAPTNQFVTNLTPTFGELPPTVEGWPLFLQVARQQSVSQPTLTPAEYTNFITGADEWWGRPYAAVPRPSYTQFAEPSHTVNLLREWRPQVGKHAVIDTATPVALDALQRLRIPQPKVIMAGFIESRKAA